LTNSEKDPKATLLESSLCEYDLKEKRYLKISLIEIFLIIQENFFLSVRELSRWFLLRLKAYERLKKLKVESYLYSDFMRLFSFIKNFSK